MLDLEFPHFHALPGSCENVFRFMGKRNDKIIPLHIIKLLTFSLLDQSPACEWNGTHNFSSPSTLTRKVRLVLLQG